MAINGEQEADWITRQAINSASELERPHISEAKANPVTPNIIDLRRPNLFANQLAKGIVTAVAIKFAVITHDIWSGLADRAP